MKMYANQISLEFKATVICHLIHFQVDKWQMTNNELIALFIHKIVTLCYVQSAFDNLNNLHVIIGVVVLFV